MSGSSNFQIYPRGGKSDGPLLVKPARPESELFNFQIYLGKTYNEPPWYHSEAKAVHGIQLYILSSFIYVVTLGIVSFGVEQVDRSVMHLFL